MPLTLPLNFKTTQVKDLGRQEENENWAHTAVSWFPAFLKINAEKQTPARGVQWRCHKTPKAGLSHSRLGIAV
jgi:hypothetical protein